MKKLIDYIEAHARRGECQCGKCCDKGPDREAPKHSVNVHFFWVAKDGSASADELRALLESEYPNQDRLRKGISYIEMGADLGDQGIALKLIGLGDLLGLWKAVTPALLGLDGESADELAGMGFVMNSGFEPAVAAA